MGKVLPFKPRRNGLRLEPKVPLGGCPLCHHKLNVHIQHPNGGVSCAARGCHCETRPTGDWPKV